MWYGVNQTEGIGGTGNDISSRAPCVHFAEFWGFCVYFVDHCWFFWFFFLHCHGIVCNRNASNTHTSLYRTTSLQNSFYGIRLFQFVVFPRTIDLLICVHMCTWHVCSYWCPCSLFFVTHDGNFIALVLCSLSHMAAIL